MPRPPLILALVLYIIVSLTACADKPKATYPKALRKDLQVDTALIAVIPYSGEWLSGKNTPAALTMDDMKQIESLLKSCARNNKVIDLKRGNYKRQYVAVTNDKGEKIVWINCFCQTDGENWKTTIIMVHDGGICYFHLKVNLTKGVYSDFWVNGYA